MKAASAARSCDARSAGAACVSTMPASSSVSQELRSLRTKRRGLLRNVCVALGNVGRCPTPCPALQRAASDPEPLIAEHARWAIDQINARGPAY